MYFTRSSIVREGGGPIHVCAMVLALTDTMLKCSCLLYSLEKCFCQSVLHLFSCVLVFCSFPAEPLAEKFQNMLYSGTFECSGRITQSFLSTYLPSHPFHMYTYSPFYSVTHFHLHLLLTAEIVSCCYPT